LNEGESVDDKICMVFSPNSYESALEGMESELALIRDEISTSTLTRSAVDNAIKIAIQKDIDNDDGQALPSDSWLDQIDMESHAGGVYMLSKDILPTSIEDDALELKDILSSLPKSVVTIAPLQSMLPENAEVSLGKHYASLGISSLLLSNACVGDDEDIKYSQFVIEGINKKSSSSFSMTGLTGSANGHFGVSSHEGEVKWRRNE